MKLLHELSLLCNSRIAGLKQTDKVRADANAGRADEAADAPVGGMRFRHLAFDTEQIGNADVIPDKDLDPV